MKKICILGSGAAGLLLLLNFEKHGIDPQCITLIDPTHNGGDLMNKWSHVRSNTTWRQIIEAIPHRTSFAHPWSTLNPDEPCELRYIIQYLRTCVKDYMLKINLRTDTVSNATYSDNQWFLTLEHSKLPVACDLVFFCQGSEPKSLDLPFSSIPLHSALDKRRLADFITAGQHILVFGTAHSGPLVVKNLLELDCKVTNFYATEKPFYFDRDGEYDGIKQDAAVIADAILEGKYTQLKLESVHDMSAVIRASKTADACVYACGFEPRLVSGFKNYDGTTGRIQDTVNAWGFGIAYPNKARDGDKPKVYWDVSVPAFQKHIAQQMPDILASLM